jgi:alkylation response protein AidB-like acyl-CoA dehydrogenase
MMTSLARLISEVIEPQAVAVDRDGTFPRAALEALGREGLLGLISARDVGGGGPGPALACACAAARPSARSWGWSGTSATRGRPR